jgi:Cys-tRNA(Pro)/Cys-tRNA(Cys) deacylase
MGKKTNSTEIKTNVMRLLEQANVNYNHYCYADTDAISGTDVAAVLNENPAQCFKTLVTVAKSGEHYVFLIPVANELDLKKAANAVHEKSIAMIKEKELLPLTGYVHGGCSPLGMKKQFKTVIHESCNEFDTILFSAGKIGYQVEVAPDDLKNVVAFETADLVV